MLYVITAVSLTIPNRCDIFVVIYRNIPSVITKQNRKNSSGEKSTTVLSKNLSKL